MTFPQRAVLSDKTAHAWTARLDACACGAGFVTTGLELWAALPCGAKHFRQRLWGTLNMPQASRALLFSGY